MSNDSQFMYTAHYKTLVNGDFGFMNEKLRRNLNDRAKKNQLKIRALYLSLSLSLDDTLDDYLIRNNDHRKSKKSHKHRIRWIAI